ncbi:MAG: hypothetical protein LDL53_08535 [Candidatus Hydrogenedens sp.]|nr:hypothetical protein [Candidatus Hydrogenedens sp.]
MNFYSNVVRIYVYIHTCHVRLKTIASTSISAHLFHSIKNYAGTIFSW